MSQISGIWKGVNIETFNFDEWVSLAKSAPDAFEQRRYELVELLISNSTYSQQLRRLQWRIDMERIRARTAMKACLRIYSLMWDSFLECNTAMNNLAYKGPLSPQKQIQPVAQAKIINFYRKL